MSLEARILVVEDDSSQREMLAGFLRDLGADVEEAAEARAALDTVRRNSLDLVITDLRMPGRDGHALLKEIREINPEIATIVVTAFGTVEGAVDCLKDGAFHYLLKPLDLDEVELVVRKALDLRHLVRENRDLKRRLGRIESVPGIVTSGGPMTEVLSTVARVAPSTVPVLILGESGTGKELLARAIHSTGRHAGGPFLAVNGAALSPTLLESELFGHERGAFTGADRARSGRFEAAAGGTLFLDEVGDLPSEAQVRLLRVLQERVVERVGSHTPIPVDARFIAATHRDLMAEVRSGRFREDLYYRLAVVSVEVPPLRRRRADVPALVEHFLDKHREDAGGRGKSVSREAMDLLIRYDFPGNVRELENIVQRCMVLARGEQIRSDDLPAFVRAAGGELSGGDPGSHASLPERVEAVEREAIDEAIALEAGNQSRAAKRLGISERTLRYKLTKYHR